MTPYISVIIPNYNHAKFLKERIESVLKRAKALGDYLIVGVTNDYQPPFLFCPSAPERKHRHGGYHAAVCGA